MATTTPRSTRMPAARSLSWLVLVTGVACAYLSVAERQVVYAVGALIVVAMAGMFLLQQKAAAAERLDRARDQSAGR